MSEPLDPVRLYLNVDLWEYENGSMGYHIRSQLDDEPDPKEVSQLANEFAQFLMGDVYDSPVLFSMQAQEDGQSHVDWSPDEEFVHLPQFLWLKKQANDGVYLCVTRGQHPYRFNWMKWIWILEWVAMRLRIKFKPNRTAPLRNRNQPPPTATPLFSEQSEGLEKSSTPIGSNVVPLRRPGKSELVG